MQYPHILWIPKIHKYGTPQVHCFQQGCCHIWSGKGVSQHQEATSRSFLHHIKNTHHLIEHTKVIQLQEGECMVFYDVKVLFTLVLVDLATSIIKNKLQQSSNFTTGTLCPPTHHQFAEFCLKIPFSSSRVSFLNRSMV